MKANFIKCKKCGSTKNTRWGGTRIICDDCGSAIPENVHNKEIKLKENTRKDMNKDEFENFIIHAGGSGSFMIFRSNKKDEELGLDEL